MARMTGKSRRKPSCCGFCDAGRAPSWRKVVVRAVKRRERQNWKREALASD